MALKLWLPLNGDLHNQGLSDVTVTNNGATVNNAGKIGKCYEFNGNVYIDTGYKESFGTGDFSIATWFYLTKDTTKSYQPIITNKTTAAVSVGCGIYFNKSQNKFLWSTADGSAATEIWMATALTEDFLYEKWHHIIMVRDSSDAKIGYFYIDGVRYELASVPAIRNVTNTSQSLVLGRMPSDNAAYRWTGRLNDVRIFDEAIPVKFAKELSKGLVLHYPLNRGGFGGDNLAPISSYGRSSGGNVYPPNTNNSLVIDGNRFIVTANPGDSIGAVATNISSSTITISAKTTYTGTGRATYRKWFDDSGNMVGSYISERITLENGRILCTLNVPTGATKITFGLCYPYNEPYEVWDLKVEEGSIATPWVPNSADALYSAMGLDDGIEHDVSGYQHNGDIIGDLTYTSDTPRYNVSTHIGATNQKIHVSGLTTSGFGNSYSFAWWGKRSSNSPMFWGFSDGVRLNGMYLGTLWNTGDASKNPLYNIGTTTQVTAPSTGVWHHYVMTGDGTKCYVYLDGELWAEAKTYKAISGTSIYINGWDSGTSYCSDNTSISDFRIYSTALDADQVKALYHTPVSIANRGTLMTQGEIVEV